MTQAPSNWPLQQVANCRLMLYQELHPKARVMEVVARHVIDCFVRETKMISSRDNGPQVDTGDILCEGYITRAALLPAADSGGYDWLAADQAWQTPGLRATGPAGTIDFPADGAAWLGPLSLLENPGVLPDSARALFTGASALLYGHHYGSGGIGLLTQPLLGERIALVLKPHRVLVITAGDTLQIIATRYGTTVQTLRSINPRLLSLSEILTAAGDTLTLLAGRYGTTVEYLRLKNPQLLRADGHTTIAGDTLKSVAIEYDTTVDTLRLYNPDYDRTPRSEPLPIGVVLNVPAIRPSSELDPGQSLLVPLVRPSTLLPVGEWIHLPEQRNVSAADDAWDVDVTPDPEPDPNPTAAATTTQSTAKPSTPSRAELFSGMAGVEI
jgi:LysM repeat protein